MLDLAASDARTVCLLEGVSDVACVRALLEVTGIDPSPIELISLGGATNLGRTLKEVRLLRGDVDVVGLVDEAESHVAVRALSEDGLPVQDATDLPVYGFFVCSVDLEDELIRTLGAERAREVLTEAGLGGKLEAMQRQDAWVGRPLAEQLHRFCGAASGRKERAAGILAGALAADELPEPLAMLLDRLRWA
ncbi:hypothetical protein [Kytococcus sedentarius]|uniref:hypothetical protein n=1 Tax=Kytococcus sedentarius TaxID=1276 RepID=UPI0019509DF0|nr:hypothetical protein [Kytococcus sedentarius]QRO88341.1 hypothetical protein I6J30_05275 [Kytococcus sedentarius]